MVRAAALPPRIRRSIEVLDAACAVPRLVQIDETGDKYNLPSAADIDCASRWELCEGACCKLELALSRQDVDEGVIAWNPNKPYLGAKGEDGRCVHQNCETGACGVYERRPAACRTYDCRNDKRIWLDFEKREVNPSIRKPGWPCWVEEGGEWPE